MIFYPESGPYGPTPLRVVVRVQKGKTKVKGECVLVHRTRKHGKNKKLGQYSGPPLVLRPIFCPKKIDLTRGLNLQAGYSLGPGTR